MRVCLLVLFWALALGVASCKKEETKEGEVTAKINGRYWESGHSTNYLSRQSPADEPAYTQLTVSAYTKDYHSTFGFTITDYIDSAEGDCVRLDTFLPARLATDTILWMGEPIKTAATFQYIDGSVNYSSLDGELVITECNPEEQTLSGTFSFTATSSSGDTLRITEGKFDQLKFGRL